MADFVLGASSELTPGTMLVGLSLKHAKVCGVARNTRQGEISIAGSHTRNFVLHHNEAC